tara:strand:+ start:1529 stop:2035 length:507 start_codon:yes stop_codon:yes gene_type:complete
MEIINSFARAYPALSIIYAVTIKDIYLISYLVISNILNGVYKYQIAKPIMGDKKYPILGKGSRPKGANHCGIWKDPPGHKTKSYGMPSGHAQEATGFATYVILDNLSKGGNILDITNIIVGFFAFFIPYSRVYLNCHTYQQVIVGGTIGILMAIIAFNLRPNILDLIK